MAAIIKRSCVTPARAAVRARVPVVCKASLQSHAASLALAGLIALGGPALPALAENTSKEIEAEMMATISARQNDKFVAAEQQLEQKALSTPEVVKPIELIDAEPPVTTTLPAGERKEAIRAEAIREAQEAAVLGASKDELKKVSPAALAANSGTSGSSSVLLLGAVAVIGIAGAATLLKPGEDAPAATPAVPAAPAAPAPPATPVPEVQPESSPATPSE